MSTITTMPLNATVEAVLATKRLEWAPTDRTSIAEWVDFCVGCAKETQEALLHYCEAEDEDMSDEEMRAAMRDSFGAAMPLITDRTTAKVYIACVAHGLAIGLLPTDQASKMVYVAQTALSAMRR